MLASRITRIERRGVVLVLVLAMLGLLALIGVTFATFSGQARINNRNYQQSLLQPQADELFDFALGQLISDTNDIRSVIHGHSLARDMYGNGSQSNGYLTASPSNGGTFSITGIAATTLPNGANAIALTTNIQAGDITFYGYNFTRWFMRVAYNANTGGGQPPGQSFEILADSGFISGSAAGRTFTVAPFDATTTLNNPTFNASGGTPLPGFYLAQLLANSGAPGNNVFPFILDGRWLSAFNGPGMGTHSTNVSINGATVAVPNSTYGNFRYAGLVNPAINPGAVGMDEDYDACDLENWFLALQSADGQVMIPSFHRPGVVRYDPNNHNAPASDWSQAYRAAQGGDSLARILRPVAADGHDAATFPDLVPDPNTGQITYDVDNDGDGIPDSVWLDLGYSARPDSSGRLYKPLFAFMVIGLNGRIPLNTAGNLAGAGSTQADHLGNSVSEVDPTYALQNAYTGSPVLSGGFDYDPFNTINSLPAAPNATYPPTNLPFPTQNMQVDNATVYNSSPVQPSGRDVRTTQLRNLLAGTRPQPTPTTGVSALNNDTNFVSGSWTSSATAQPYFIPNGIADGSDANIITDSATPPNPYVQRLTLPVGGRWGEAQSVPGVPFPNPNGNPPLNLVQSTYIDPIRAGYSFDVSDLFTYSLNNNITPFPRDAADDNYNAFDPFPAGHTGEVGDSDFFDSAGALLLPVERMRRYVTPADINGTGSVLQWNATPPSGSPPLTIGHGPNLGADNFGRVQFSSYFRPAGDPGMIAVKYTYNSATQTVTPAPGTTLGAIYYPSSSAPSPDPFYTGVPNPINPVGVAPTPAASAYPSYLPDQTNNLLHGFESYKLPNLFQNPGAASFTQVGYSPQGMGGMPISDVNALFMNHGGSTNFPAGYTNPPRVPTAYQTYDSHVNSADRSDGMNEADEMNLYQKNPLLDSPYGPSDLEWLYRQQDVDGASLSSRLAQLAPISFTNLIDGQRRRRLVSLDSWETNNFVWTNDNPQGSFANNARFTPTQSASFQAVNLPTPSLAQRDRKINLNYPLPVSNDCNEPIRQKWISDTYQLLKVILPPDSVDTAEELQQLSQFVINIIDFRDPDSTMTHWVNPDVVINPGTPANPNAVPPIPATASTLTRNLGNGSLDQYGMEYNPVAINEALAYSFTTKTSAAGGGAYTQTNRFFIELVNTLTAAYNPNYDYGSPPMPANTANNYYGNASALDLGGFNYTSGDPYSGACWDLIFTNDDPMSRPDPYRGELVYANSAFPTTINYYGLIPLNRDTFGTSGTAPNQGDVTLLPVNPNAINPALVPNAPSAVATLPMPQTTPPTTYFYVIGNPPNSTATESNPPSNKSNAAPNAAVTQALLPNYDPVSTVPVSPPPFKWYPGILPVQPNSNQPQNAPPSNYASKIPSFPQSRVSTPTGTSRPATNYWVCLRRPANLFAPVSATNPMCVVDSMRFPYIEGTGSTISTSTDNLNNTYTQGPYNTIYSAQRLQPFRGGHAVAASNATGTITTTQPPDPRYGYTEQLAVPQKASGAPSNYGFYYQGTNSKGKAVSFNATNFMYHTLGLPNDSAENWDYLTFNDRDFTSVAELLLVAGCPPGLFTKQFVEAAPSQVNAANIFATVTPILTPTFPFNKGGGYTVGGGGGSSPAPIPYTTPTVFATASVPFLSISQASASLGSPAPPVPSLGTPALVQPIGGITNPVQPHTFPYLVDKFFYTGASGFYYPPSGISTDPSSATPSIPVVGGPAADGWFKMFEFLEVPSQMIGAIGPVANGTNFDWYRQDSKPGLMNINLIIDEEAFFSVFGKQNAAYLQTLLNSIELPYLLNPQTGLLPYALPLSTANNGAPPIPQYGPPVPLVVSAIQASGAPNYVYPLTSQTQQVQHGFLTTDPILQAINVAAGSPPVGFGNRLKAAFAQFLWLRHGGSGYLFGYGNGATGQNSAVATPALANIGYNGPIPSERYFRSLSFPDINYTIMRPAALPPSTVSAPAMLPDPNSSNPVVVAVANAQALLYQPASAPSNWYFVNPSLNALPYFYAPYVTPNTTFTNNAPNAPVVYTGDPGVRNPLLSMGYSTSQPLSSSPYPVSNTAGKTVPAGTPLPVNVAFPVAGANPPTTASVVMPPPIPTRRLFEAPDAYGTGAIVANGYTGIANLPPPLSNAGDSGDPWINNQIPNLPTQTAPTAASYTLNNGFSTLEWSGGTLYPNTNGTAPPSPATGALPLISTANYAPYSTLAPTTDLAPANAYLGGAAGPNTDDRQHPYWRSEQLQKAMNLTTVRTHQYAVWITIGFFEVKRQGDLGMFATNPQLAFDIMGPEIGAANGKRTRFRGFYLVDRLQLTGFNPNSPGQFRSAVVYSKRIQ
jgi:hypothetical protein